MNQNKICIKCNILKPLDDFYVVKLNRDGHQNTCKECHLRLTREYRKKMWNVISVRRKHKYEEEKEEKRLKWAATKRKHRKKNRDIALEIVGGKTPKCKMHDEWLCCGDPTNRDFLTFDHINNDGKKHRKEIGIGKTSQDIYVWIKKNPKEARKRLQIMCMNANIKKAWRQ